MAEAPPLLEFADDTAGFKKEYSGFVDSIAIDGSDTTKITVKTKEGVTLDIHFTPAGWTVINVDDSAPSEVKKLQGDTHEGIESLMMAASHEFQRIFQETLAQKLRALS